MHPGTRSHVHCYQAVPQRPEDVHQAQYNEMEILTEYTAHDTVSQVQEWPVRDTVTTFQISGTTRVLIARNTKPISSIWKQREFLTLRNVKNTKKSGNVDLHGNAYIDKSRSRAGSTCQTRTPDLVVFILVS